jgi:hypothetical protein
MCLFLQVLQPLRDLVWLFLGGPPPGPAMLSKLVPSQPKGGPDGYIYGELNQKKLGVLLLWWVLGSCRIPHTSQIEAVT